MNGTRIFRCRGAFSLVYFSLFSLTLTVVLRLLQCLTIAEPRRSHLSSIPCYVAKHHLRVGIWCSSDILDTFSQSFPSPRRKMCKIDRRLQNVSLENLYEIQHEIAEKTVWAHRRRLGCSVICRDTKVSSSRRIYFFLKGARPVIQCLQRFLICPGEIIVVLPEIVVGISFPTN